MKQCYSFFLKLGGIKMHVYAKKIDPVYVLFETMVLCLISYLILGCVHFSLYWINHNEDRLIFSNDFDKSRIQCVPKVCLFFLYFIELF